MGLFDSIWDTCTEWEPFGTIWTEWAGILAMIGSSTWSTYSSGSEGVTTGAADSTTADYYTIPGFLLLSSTGSSFIQSSGPVQVFGPFWQDSSGGWHLGNMVPYSNVEKRAELVYDSLHRRKQKKELFPVIVAENTEVYEAASRLLGGRTPASMNRILEVLEKALLNESDHEYAQ